MSEDPRTKIAKIWRSLISKSLSFVGWHSRTAGWGGFPQNSSGCLVATDRIWRKSASNSLTMTKPSVFPGWGCYVLAVPKGPCANFENAHTLVPGGEGALGGGRLPAEKAHTSAGSVIAVELPPVRVGGRLPGRRSHLRFRRGAAHGAVGVHRRPELGREAVHGLQRVPRTPP